MRGLSHGRIVHMEIVANGAHHHLAAIQPDSDLDGHAFGALHLGGILA